MESPAQGSSVTSLPLNSMESNPEQTGKSSVAKGMETCCDSKRAVKRVSLEVSGASVRLVTGQILTAASPPPSAGNQEQRLRENLKTMSLWDFPGGPVVKGSMLPLQGARVRSLVGELRSYVLCGTAKNKKKTMSPSALGPPRGPISVVRAQPLVVRIVLWASCPGMALRWALPGLLGSGTRQRLSLGPGESGLRSRADCLKGWFLAPSCSIGLCQ